MSQAGKIVLSSDKLDLWPQGPPGKIDGISPDGRQGHQNEEVIWIRHKELDDCKSAFRVPEGIGWQGKQMVRIDQLTPTNHHYQIGQEWRLSGGKLHYDNCPISDMFGPSPGRVSASMELVDEEIVRMEMVLANDSESPLRGVNVHFCFNHRRAPLLGREIFAMSDIGWVDFSRYLVDDPFRKYHFIGQENPNAWVPITRPLLFSETNHEKGMFTSVIGSSDATDIMSNHTAPCTDTGLHFGTIQPGESLTRQLFIALGFASKDAWLERMSERVP